MLTSEEKLKQTVQKQSTETLKTIVWALGTGKQEEAGLLAFGFASAELSK
jgi:predicted KAP-like P-loop ATPase